MAPRVKIEPFLSDRGACEQEGPKRAVEGGPHRVLAELLVVFGPEVPEAEGEYRADAEVAWRDRPVVGLLEEAGMHP